MDELIDEHGASPEWTQTSEAIFWLNEIEKYQGGANGPTIKLRAAILASDKINGEAVAWMRPIQVAEDEWDAEVIVGATHPNNLGMPSLVHDDWQPLYSKPQSSSFLDAK